MRAFTCEMCGDGFVPARASARFCSTRCRIAAHRQRAPARPEPSVATLTARIAELEQAVADQDERIAELQAGVDAQACSFCGQDREDGVRLLRGIDALICHGCVTRQSAFLAETSVRKARRALMRRVEGG